MGVRMSVSQCQDYHLNISSNLHHFYEEEVVPHEEDLFLSNAEQRWNKGLICKHCGKCVAIEGENHLWVGIEEILGSQVCAFVLYLIPEESSNIGDTFFTGPGRMERSCVS